MGGQLSVPLQTKLVSQCSSGVFTFTGVEMHGARVTMEDECIICPKLNTKQHLVVVLDGHGGTGASEFGKKELCTILKSMPAPLTSSHIQLALMGLDILMRSVRPTDRSGCAVAGVVLSGYEALVFHAGDSRVIVFDEQSGEIIHETRDHKPTDPSERTRIYQAGGQVIDGRVSGELAVSRGIGDFRFKQKADLEWTDQQVTANPECTVVPMKPSYVIMVYCDGVVERVTSNKSVVDTVCQAISEGHNNQDVMCKVLDQAFASGSTDNMSAIMIRRASGNSNDPAVLPEMIQSLVDDHTASALRLRGKTLPESWITAKRAFLTRSITNGNKALNHDQVRDQLDRDIIEPVVADVHPNIAPIQQTLSNILHPVPMLDPDNDEDWDPMPMVQSGFMPVQQPPQPHADAIVVPSSPVTETT